jgi:hypothetical protein
VSIRADGYEDLRAAIVNGVLLPGRSGHSYTEHADIVEAIAAHDRVAAEQAMRRHLLHLAEALRARDRVERSEAAAASAVQD